MADHLGLRGDYFAASVNSMLQPANSGNPDAMIASPKFTSTFGPFYKTEFFVGAGLGYHSNDARGVTATQVPGDPGRHKLLRLSWCVSRGRDRSPHQDRAGLDSSISLFVCIRIRNCFSRAIPAPPHRVRLACAPASRSPMAFSRVLVPPRCRLGAVPCSSSASIPRNRSS